MLKALLTALLLVLGAGMAHACNVPNPNNTAPPGSWVDGCDIPASALNQLASITGFKPEIHGAKRDGVTDDTVALQDAIQDALAASVSAPSAGGTAVVYLSPGTYLFTPPLLVQTSNCAQSIKIVGAGRLVTTLKEQSGKSADFIDVGQAGGCQMAGVEVTGIGFQGNSPTAGYAMTVSNVANGVFSDLWLQNTWGGIHDTRTNSNIYENIFGYTQGTNSQAFLWDGGATRSDQLILHDIGINAQFYGNDGFVWQGMANTLDATNLIFLQTNHGFWVNNSLNTVSNFPQFSEIYDLQVEGAKTAACEIDGGRQLHFTDGFCHSEYGETGTGGSQGNNDNGALVITPDASTSVTSTIHMTGMSIGLSAKSAASMQAQGVYITNTDFRGSSLSSVLGYPSVNLPAGSGSADYIFTGDKFCGTYGDALDHNYGLIRGAGVGSISVIGGDFNYCQTGEIQDNSSVSGLSVTGSISKSGAVLPISAGFYVSGASPTLTSCGSSPVINGNNLVGAIVPGTGATACTVNFSSTNAAGNNGLGQFLGVVIQATGTGTGSSALVSSGSTTAFTFTRADGASMAGTTYYYRATQGAL